jgi:hypothetical protein
MASKVGKSNVNEDDRKLRRDAPSDKTVRAGDESGGGERVEQHHMEGTMHEGEEVSLCCPMFPSLRGNESDRPSSRKAEKKKKTKKKKSKKEPKSFKKRDPATASPSPSAHSRTKATTPDTTEQSPPRQEGALNDSRALSAASTAKNNTSIQPKSSGTDGHDSGTVLGLTPTTPTTANAPFTTEETVSLLEGPVGTSPQGPSDEAVQFEFTDIPTDLLHHQRRSGRRNLNSSSRWSISSTMSVEITSLPRSPLRPVRAGEMDASAIQFCDLPYAPKLHKTPGPCCVCVYRLTQLEREQFEETGRSLHVTTTQGGCTDCKIFPQGECDFEPVRLCRTCFFDTHRQHVRPHKPFTS